MGSLAQRMVDALMSARVVQLIVKRTAMHAVILDIDGTLLNSNEIDDSLYLSAVRRVLGQAKVRESWGLYRNVTDSGILDEILKDNSLTSSVAIVGAVRDHFVESIRQHVERVGPFVELPGAREFVAGLRASNSHCVAYATGGWSASASIKLKSAGFPLQGIPLASSDDYPDRESIMVHALNQLGGEFQSVTYYGDGNWDEVASRNLGWKFVAVGEKLGGLAQFGLAPMESPKTSTSGTARRASKFRGSRK
jgi:phosphoglycolate phosphatase-like HAD superfamily hydrolase